MIYETDSLYLYEILEDYQTADSLLKDCIFQAFFQQLLSSGLKPQTYEKHLTYRVRKDLRETPLGTLYNACRDISYTTYKKKTDQTGYASLISQKLRNLYARMCDPNICILNGYVELLSVPRTLYYAWQKGAIQNPEQIQQTIAKALEGAARLKETGERRKLQLSQDTFQELCFTYLRRIFENYTPLSERTNQTLLLSGMDCWNEDHYCIRYFCKSLDGYFRQYQKAYYGLYNPGSKNNCTFARCYCGNLYQKKSNRQKYCPECRNRQHRIHCKSYREKMRAVTNARPLEKSRSTP